MKKLKIKSVEVFVINVPFKEKFIHSSKSRTNSENIIVKINSNYFYGLGEGIPREYVTGENVDSVLKVLRKKIIPYFKNKTFNNFNEVIKIILKYLPTLNKNELTAFSCFEQALINLSAQKFHKNLKDILNILNIEYISRNEFFYSAIISDGFLIKKLIKSFFLGLRKFKFVKIKISKSSYLDLKYIVKFFRNSVIRVDANEDFNLENIKNLFILLNKLKIRFIEQPFAVNLSLKDKIKIHTLANKYNIKIILDEDLCLFSDTSKILNSTNRIGDIANIRISKNGGILNSLLIYNKLKKRNFESVLGCMVGETILSRYNIILSQKLNFLFNEGNYDDYLLKTKFITTHKFRKNGSFIYKSYLINNKINLNKNFKNLIAKQLYF